MDSHETCLQNKLRNIEFLHRFLDDSSKVLAIPSEVSAHFAKTNGDLTWLLHYFFPQVFIEHSFFHLYK